MCDSLIKGDCLHRVVDLGFQLLATKESGRNRMPMIIGDHADLRPADRTANPESCHREESSRALESEVSFGQEFYWPMGSLGLVSLGE